MPDAAKHGTVIPITQKEYDALMAKWGTPKQEGNQTLSNSPVLKYDFEKTEGKTVKDTSQAGAENNGTLTGDAAVVQVEGKGNVLQLNGSGSLVFPQGFFDGLSNMTLSMDVCTSGDAAVFSMGSTVKNKISSYTVTANGAEKRDRYWDALPAQKYLNLNLTGQSVSGEITTFNEFGKFEVFSEKNLNLKDNWKNVAIVMDQHVMSIYVDKELVARHEHVRSVEELGSSLTAVLGASYGEERGFKGYIDNVTVYGWSAENMNNPEQANQEVANQVVALIQAIGKVNASSKAKIEEARKAYNSLTDVQKTLVTNVSVLDKAETEYKDLENQQTGNIDISKAVISSVSAQNYTGKEIKPQFTVTCNGTKLNEGTDYSVDYQKNKNIGTAQILITGKGKYTGKAAGNFQITVFKGKTYQAGKYKYKMTNANISGKGTVALTGVNSKSIKQIKVMDTVSLGGKKFKVTAVGDNAFKNCKKAVSASIGKNVRTIGRQAFMNCGQLKKITIKSTALKQVGKNALKGISKKAVIKVPAKNLKKYQKILKGKGQNKQVKIKK